jgi:hypothetical protein
LQWPGVLKQALNDDIPRGGPIQVDKTGIRVRKKRLVYGVNEDFNLSNDHPIRIRLQCGFAVDNER